MVSDSATPSAGSLAGFAAAVMLVAALSWLALRPAQASAPATAFSTARASADLAALSRAPRPIASGANREARNYLLERLRAIGLEPQVQRALVQKNFVDYNANYEATMGVVHNVLVRLPGTASDHRGPRSSLLLVAHLDSDRATLGASKAAPVAALIDTLRVLRAGAPLKNDVIVLFADGERVGSLGMQAFAEQHPWARDVGLALRFDGGGSGGPLLLYNTLNANSAAIDGWLRAAPDVAGSSLMHEIHQLAPGALRIGALGLLRVPVLQFAHTGRPYGRESVLDTPQRYDAATLQQMRDAMLRLTRAFGHSPIDARPSRGQVYFALPFIGTVHYSGMLVWPLTGLTCLLLAGALHTAMRRVGVGYMALLQAFFIVPSIAVALGVGAWQLWMHVPALHRAWNPAAPDHARQALLYLAAVCALCSGGFIVAERLLQRFTGAVAALLAGLTCLVLVLLLTSWLAPGASYLIVWPLLAALVSFAVLHAPRVAAWPPAARLTVLLAGVLPALVLVLPVLRDSYLVLSPQRMNLPIAMLALLLGVSTLLLAHARRFIARTLLLAGLAGLGSLALAGSAGSFTETPPLRANALVYYKDMPSWDAYWLRPAGELDPWERALFANLKEPHIFVNVFGWESPRQWYAWAPRDGLKFPFVRVLRNGKAPDRHADFTLVSQNRAPELRLRVIGARPTRVTMNGRVLLDTEAKSLTMVLYGMEDALLHFKVQVLADPLFAVHIEEVLPGLPEHLLAPRPASGLIPLSGQSISSDTLWFY